MPTLSKDQVKQIIQGAPQGTDPKDIVNGLVKRGYTLEGLNDQNPSGATPDQPKQPALYNPDHPTLSAVASNPAVRALSSVGKGMEDVFVGGVKGIVNAPRNMANLGAQIGDLFSNMAFKGKATYKPGETFATPESWKESNTAQKIGSFGSNLALGLGAGSAMGGASSGIFRGAGEGFLQAGMGTGDLGQAKLGAVLGGAVPLGQKVVTGLLKTITPVTTGLERNLLKDVFQNPQKYDDAAKILQENPNQPFLGLANKVKDKIVGLRDSAQEAWQTAANAFKESNATTRFNISKDAANLGEALDGFGLKLVPGKGRQLVLQPKGTISPLPPEQMAKLQEVVDTIRGSTAITPDDIVNIRNVFDNAYNAVPYSLQGNPTKYHAAVMAMKDGTEDIIDKLLPKQLKQANQMYRDYYQAYRDLGSKIIDQSGEVRPGAESFLSNLGNMNKGQLRTQAQRVSDLIGMDVTDEAATLKNAQKLSNVFPATGSRTQDIVRSLGIKAAASSAVPTAFLANPAAGLALGGLTALSSPALVSNAAKIAGKVSAKAAETLPLSISQILGRLINAGQVSAR